MFFFCDHIKDGGNDKIHGNRNIPANSKPDQGFLFVHRIPKICKPEHLKILFEHHAGGAKLAEIPEVAFKGKHGKTVVTFETQEEAEKAFEAIAGKAEADASGDKKQKRVFLKQGGYLNVREM
uniref:RRM domain-containing protein n=1 Tax=Corethron hystrix TaxID=216773 RepID=A0A7S1B826_9STRA